MNTKKLLYALVPTLLGAGLLGVNIASAHGGGFGFGGGFDLAAKDPATFAQQLTTRFENDATLLGVGVDEVKTAWSQGKNLHDLAKEKGITDAQLQAKFEEARAKALAANMQILVDKGVITRAQADARIAAMKSKATERGTHEFKKGGTHMMRPMQR